MHRTRLLAIAAGLLIPASRATSTAGRADDVTSASPEADRRFETLRAASLKAPEKADWKALRAAFAETTHYRPYSIDATEKLRAIALSIGRGETREGEAALLALLEDERSMRLDTVAMLMMLYLKTDRPEKAEQYRPIVDGILGVLKYPTAGTSLEDPIHVLFIDEEYFVVHNMPIKARVTAVDDGHDFDVFDIEADGDRPARKVYFNIDLPRRALSRSLKPRE